MTSTLVMLENEQMEAEMPIVQPAKDRINPIVGLFFILGCVAAWTGIFWAVNFLSNKLLG